MVRSIDDVRPDAVPIVQAATTPCPPENASCLEARPDLYAEAELRLRHERTERFIEKASRELA